MIGPATKHLARTGGKLHSGLVNLLLGTCWGRPFWQHESVWNSAVWDLDAPYANTYEVIYNVPKSRKSQKIRWRNQHMFLLLKGKTLPAILPNCHRNEFAPREMLFQAIMFLSGKLQYRPHWFWKTNPPKRQINHHYAWVCNRGPLMPGTEAATYESDRFRQ